ncbi:tryptophan 2,3-dioxygenase family protein [Streptomyces sp. A3M-1-3]|uniref:tryptophan 2,3-dioxygenase n=1 Tax=Streptomyces sp. A3M-1-3 TaxID=2962044 RepID=UPI0020B72C6D|nr:tryptophan 2,3-dioxygenase family protein [Streptomyces sp. A3M-1-3]MCP3820194.1 tryptophan 2,3-dioxygenase family protein [Streptomyces sp. A3M-1-3]
MNNAHSGYYAYCDYLALGPLLDIQRPTTEQPNELLFIVVHQSHELWFKELLHELDSLQVPLRKADSGPALRTLRRARVIIKSLTVQINVLETLTSEQFDTFRAQLGGSGFYSAQFREIEIVLGRRDKTAAALFPEGSPDRARIEARAAEPRLFDAFLAYLSAQGYSPDDLPSALREVHADDGVEEQICQALVDLDQAFQEWKYRHVVLVQRVIGDRVGTGGTSGAEFLRRAIFTPSFPVLWNMRKAV